MKTRNNTGHAGEPIQSSMIYDEYDHPQYGLNGIYFGIIMDVYPADARGNSSSDTKQDFRGSQLEATVQVVNDGHGGVFRVDNVKIPTAGPSGIGNYEEQVPRGSSLNMGGGDFDSSLHTVSPEQLDGDWCSIAFLGGNIDEPIILSWYANPNNVFDPQTSGEGSPNSSGEGTTLDQRGRYYKRVNGFELTVTPAGDIYASTQRGGAVLDLAQGASRGRPPQRVPTEGGNFKLCVKEGASFELDWTAEVNGLGHDDIANNFIPQTNPNNEGAGNPPERTFTYFKITKQDIAISTELSIKLEAEKLVLGQEDATIEIPGSNITIGDLNASTESVKCTSSAAFNVAKELAETTPTGTGDQGAANALAIEAIQAFLATLELTTITKVS